MQVRKGEGGRAGAVGVGSVGGRVRARRVGRIVLELCARHPSRIRNYRDMMMMMLDSTVP